MPGREISHLCFPLHCQGSGYTWGLSQKPDIPDLPGRTVSQRTPKNITRSRRNWHLTHYNVKRESRISLFRFLGAYSFLVELKFGFCGGRKTAKSPEKNPRSKARTKNKLNKHTATGRNQTQATLVGGERSHYSDISVLLISCMTLRQVTGVMLSSGLSFCITLSHLYLVARNSV